jgi:pimeloyl-ACP methyl ester carboxylesterase
VIVRYAGLKGAISPDGYVFVSALLVKNPTFTISSGQGKSTNNGAKDVVSKFHMMRRVLLDILNRLGFTALNTLPIVHFDFPMEIEARAQSNVKSYSYTMIRQMDVHNYFYGFKNIDRPLLMIIGQADVVVQPEDLKIVFDQYVPSGIDKSFKVLAKYDHFNIVWGAGKAIGEWITTRLGNPVDLRSGHLR